MPSISAVFLWFNPFYINDPDSCPKKKGTTMETIGRLFEGLLGVTPTHPERVA